MKPWVLVAIAFVMAACVPIALAAIAGCSSSPPKPVVDVSSYTAEQLACVEKEPTDACRADKPACKARIDACRAEVRARYGATP